VTENPSSSPLRLRRELGKWDLTALGVNQVIGGAVFAVPATLAAALGAWSWLAIGVVGLLAMAVALNFAEAGSRFDGTGGPYLYTRAAFGRFFSFEVGWVVWLVRVTSWSSVVNVLVSALGFYWPVVTTGLARTTLVTAVVLGIMAINIRGIKQSSLVVNALTIAKLTPLAIFIVFGLPHVTVAALRPEAAITWEQVSKTVLLLIFAFGGYEVIPVPAGEARDPRRDVPFAMIATIVIVTLVMTLAQVVSLGTLPGLATSTTPLADAALVFLGAAAQSS
jgi:amino acid transporter